MDGYIAKETGKAVPVLWTLTDAGPANTEYNVNTSLFAKYRFHNNKETSLVSTHLVGRTMMAIV